ncbi:MCE associated membrane protein [Mycobacteroides abscessus subsp. bolletii]|uniref:hypothetical protein n=1 Tax=Mycobacteroides abscessus TaxID=36809 RepID=UPI0009A77CB3|nr:hypothetical protein [Mycobacteroides abscessus]SKG72393.1 MCE associated membrane protein [Mycobacteroides abscessus subsp. bolletii]SKH10416.1 MCE associated membrane protein [Mycobacteroides abscessus subsp. bolletii]
MTSRPHTDPDAADSTIEPPTGHGEIQTSDSHEAPADGDTEAETANTSTQGTQSARLTRVLTFVILPVVVLALAAGAGYAKYLLARQQALDTARIESVAAAKDITASMLSYTPDTAAATLGAARERMTGALRDSYTSLTHDVVIPGAQQKHISASATIAAAASLSATENHAVVLVFVNQSITQGQDAPTGTASTVRVTLEKLGSRWVTSGFDPE